jgi:uncharacterized YccA/Bax inhibitor family protein
MRTSNPALNEKTFAAERAAVLDADFFERKQREQQAGVGAGPLETMTVNGVVEKSAFLVFLLVVAGAFGWSSVERSETEVVVPGWLILALLGGLAIAIATIVKPRWSPVTAPLYAVVQGLLLGAISALYESQFEGIVLQAVGLTIGVFLTMLAVYALRIIKVTDNLRIGIIAATGGVFLVYLVSIVLRLFGAGVPFIHDAGPVGIGFSLVVVVIAALNLVLDFDFIEHGAANGMPRFMEWYAGFGLLVTLVWLYLEILRLLAKLRSR